jgi:hypothetical protein
MEGRMNNPKNPIQPLVKDASGTIRFKRNSIIDALLEHGQKTGFGLNEIAFKFASPQHNDDHAQLAQLIGYSLSGYGELSYVSDYSYATAEAMATSEVSEKDARIAYLENELLSIREALREPIAQLFGVHPEDLAV